MSSKELWKSLMLIREIDKQDEELLVQVRKELAVLTGRQPKPDMLRVQLY